MEKQKVIQILQGLDIDEATKQKLIARVEKEGYTQDVQDEVARILDEEESKVEKEIDKIYGERAEALKGIELTEEEQAELKKVQSEYKKDVDEAVGEYKKEMEELNKELDEDVKQVEDDQKKN